MAINVSDLPPKYQEQAMKKYMEQQKQRRGPAPPAAPPQDPTKGTKYHNTPTERGRPAFRQPERGPQVRRSGRSPGKGADP